MANIYLLKVGEEKYIGSTCNLTRRLYCHKSRTYNSNDKRYNEKLYVNIRLVEWVNVECEILETCEKDTRHIREQHFIDTLKPTLNTFRVIKDKDYFKQWDIHINCECGGKYSKSHKLRHFKSKKHLKFISENNISS